MSLRFDDISFAYRAGPRILKSITGSVEAGAATSIVGPNGSGKSTMLRIAAGLLTPGSGRVSIGGNPLSSMSARRLAATLAYVPQRPSVVFGFSVRDVVAFGGDRRPQDASLEEALDRVGLADRARDPFGELSAGQQQRAALARALVQVRERGCAVLLADEPTSAQDPAWVGCIAEIFAGLARDGVAVLCATHDLLFAQRSSSAMVTLAPDGTGEFLRRLAGREEYERLFGTGFASASDVGAGVYLPA